MKRPPDSSSRSSASSAVIMGLRVKASAMPVPIRVRSVAAATAAAATGGAAVQLRDPDDLRAGRLRAAGRVGQLRERLAPGRERDPHARSSSVSRVSGFFALGERSFSCSAPRL